jgi:hypothetical protein
MSDAAHNYTGPDTDSTTVLPSPIAKYLDGTDLPTKTQAATMGVDSLSPETGIPTTSLMRMLSDKGNPRAGNLATILKANWSECRRAYFGPCRTGERVGGPCRLTDPLPATVEYEGRRTT